jgi:hypothetical protein
MTRRGPFALLPLFLLIASPARADDTIKHPGDHPLYHVEAEPHVLLGWDTVYAQGGIGVGGRFSIPIVDNGFVPSINNSVAIGFGVDWLHYNQCWWHGDCAGNYFWFPVVMQWNFFVAQRWSVFGEPGLVIFHGDYGSCNLGPNPQGQNPCPDAPRANGFYPTLYLGGRFHLSEGLALTMRIGFPTFSFGVSFFP